MRAAWRQGGERTCRGVRPGGGRDPRALRPVRRRLGGGRPLSGVDEPRRPGDAACPRVSASTRFRRTRPTRSPPTRSAATTRRCSIPRWSIRPTARSSSPISCTRSRASRATGRWRAFRDEEIARIRAKVGKARVICGLSGGVDSAVAAVLIHEAVGDQLTCVFVDHGLMRQGEADEVVEPVPRPFQHSARPC